MKTNKTLVLVVLFGVVAVFGSAGAETWRIGEGQQLQATSQESDGYLLAVAEIKQLVNDGEVKKFDAAVADLKGQYPEMAGEDFDSFMAAERLLAKGKMRKAVHGYDKFFEEYPDSGLFYAALEREFEIATAYLGGKKVSVLKIFRIKGYAHGAKIMERISERAGNAPIAKSALVAVAENYEQREKFLDSHGIWSEIEARWFREDIGRVALLAMARCMHSEYSGPKFDASVLRSSRTYYQNYKVRYSQAAKEINVDAILVQIEEQLAYKELSTGKYYDKVGDVRAAEFYYRKVIDSWGDTAAGAEARELMGQ